MADKNDPPIPPALVAFDAAPESFDLPDPEDETITNRDRACFAAVGVAVYGRAKNQIHGETLLEDPVTIVQDLLTDLRHFCDGHGFAFAEIDARAERMYADETDTFTLDGDG